MKRRGKFVKNRSQLPFIVPRMLIVKAKTGISSETEETSAIVFSHAGVGDDEVREVRQLVERLERLERALDVDQEVEEEGGHREAQG